MASYAKMYLHAASSSITGTLPAPGTQSVNDSTPSFTATGADTNRAMDNTLGVAQASLAATGSFLAASQNVWFGRWVSEALNAATFGSGTWTRSGAASETSTNANMFFPSGCLYLWRPSTGARIGFIFDRTALNFGVGASEPGTAETGYSGTQTGVNVTALAGDVLVFEAWCLGTPAMAASYTITEFYDGTTEASTTSNASFLQAPANISFQDPVVASGPNWAPRSRSFQHLIRRAVAGGYRRRRSGIAVPELWLPESSGVPLTVPA